MTSTYAAPLRRFRRSLILAALLTSVAGAALAKPVAPDDRTARIQQLEQQFQTMEGELAQLRAQGGVSADTLNTFQQQLDSFGKALADLKGQTDTNTADIITLKQPPTGSAVTVSLPNGRPTLATADGRFTANLHSIIQFDAGAYIQSAPGQATGAGATDFRRSGGAGTGGFGTSGSAASARKLNSSTDFRRARIGIDGKIFGDFDYEAIYDFGGSGGENAGQLYALDATWHPDFLKPFKVRVGGFEPNIGMEANISTGSMPLMERPSPAEVSRNIAAGDTRSAVQVFGNGDIGGNDNGLSAYWLGRRPSPATRWARSTPPAAPRPSRSASSTRSSAGSPSRRTAEATG
jgi:phosphate-selective porin OprO/OprP